MATERKRERKVRREREREKKEYPIHKASPIFINIKLTKAEWMDKDDFIRN